MHIQCGPMIGRNIAIDSVLSSTFKRDSDEKIFDVRSGSRTSRRSGPGAVVLQQQQHGDDPHDGHADAASTSAIVDDLRLELKDALGQRRREHRQRDQEACLARWIDQQLEQDHRTAELIAIDGQFRSARRVDRMPTA